VVAILGDVFIRGSNLLFVSTEPDKVTFFEPDQPKQHEASLNQSATEEEEE